MSLYPLTEFEVQKYYQHEPKFNGLYSKNKLTKIKGWSICNNIDAFKSIATHWIALYVNGNTVIYFDSFGGEHIPKEIEKFIGTKSIITNIYRIQACNLFDDAWILLYSIYWFYAKRLKFSKLNKLFSPNKYENDKMILKYFQ